MKGGHGSDGLRPAGERGGRGWGVSGGAEFLEAPKAPEKIVDRLEARKKILLPSAKHLEEGRGTTILEVPRLENCISRLCSRPLGCHPPPNNTQIG